MKIRLPAVMMTLLVLGIYFLSIPAVMAGGILLTGIYTLYALYKKPRIDTLLLLLLLNYIYWLASGLLVSAINFSDFSSLEFLDGEGRLLVNYFPLVCLSIVSIRKADIDQFERGIWMIPLITVPLLAVWVIFKPLALSVGQSRDFVGFMTTHTGAGIFFGFTAAVLLVTGFEKKSVWNLLVGIVAVAILLATASRQALVGIVVVMAWYVVTSGNKKVMIGMAVVGVMGFLGLLVFFPRTLERTASIIDPNIIEEIVYISKTSYWNPAVERRFNTYIERNVASRIVYWNHAWTLFRASPVFGAGFGRFNDSYLEFAGVENVAFFAVGGENFSGTLSSHNSYFNILAELGVVGLILILLVWLKMYTRLGKGLKDFSEDDQMRAYFKAGQALVVFIFVGAFFGHAFASPAIGFPALGLIGALLSFQRNQLQEEGR
ncbi:MAG: O-antigen ligase family protein [Anaerolineae bacterium]|nr:O-antigen ligase family protein [Anaerolineae bacterium]